MMNTPDRDRLQDPLATPTYVETEEATFFRLALLSLVDYDKVRETEAKRLSIRVATLDKEVARRRPKEQDHQQPFEVSDPWPEPVEGARLLDDISQAVKRFIVCDDATAVATALWVSMTHFIDVVQVCPLAIITAPEKRCGKSQLLWLIGKLASRSLPASNISPAALFRCIDAWQPTLMIDEADAFMKESEEIRGILNAGHSRESAHVIRVVGDDHEPKAFNVFGAKAIAGIGHLADTLMDRAIVLELRRKKPDEQVDRLRHAEPGLFEALRSKLVRYAADNLESLRHARPVLPDEINDRAADNWEILLAIANLAGSNWPDKARKAALKISGEVEPVQTVGIELLSDIKEIFNERGVDKLFTADLIEALCSDEEKSWATYNRGKPLSPRQLGKRLSEYGIASADIRIGYTNKKGYQASHFADAFARYLQSPHLSATPRQVNDDGGFSVAGGNPVALQINLSVTKPGDDEAADLVGQAAFVADIEQCSATENAPATLEAAPTLGCRVVADKSPKSPEVIEGDI